VNAATLTIGKSTEALQHFSQLVVVERDAVIAFAGRRNLADAFHRVVRESFCTHSRTETGIENAVNVPGCARGDFVL